MVWGIAIGSPFPASVRPVDLKGNAIHSDSLRRAVTGDH